MKDCHVTHIEGYSHAGEGIGRLDGKPVFIPFAARGETVRYKLSKENKRYARGTLLEVIQPSKNRIDKICNWYSSCGGCHLQHIDYKEELSFKHQKVVQAMKRIGGFKNIVVENVLGMENHWHYRHTARFHIGQINNETIIGYYRCKSHSIVPATGCALLPTNFLKITAKIAELLNQEAEPVRTHFKEVILRKGLQTSEILILFLVESLPATIGKFTIEKLLQSFPDIVGIVAKDTRNDQVILYGRDYYTDKIAETKFKIPADAFFQNNPTQTETLVNTVAHFCNPQNQETLFDLYCGVGLFALTMAPKFKHVHGIEENRTALEAAIKNALLNNITNCQFTPSKIEKILKDSHYFHAKPDTIIIDPPRQGCTNEALDNILRLRPQKIVYVSCDPATLARDLKHLTQAKYDICVVQPVDMFPRTHHVECVVLLEKAQL